jgi:hypothetical protein
MQASLVDNYHSRRARRNAKGYRSDITRALQVIVVQPVLNGTQDEIRDCFCS